MNSKGLIKKLQFSIIIGFTCAAGMASASINLTGKTLKCNADGDITVYSFVSKNEVLVTTSGEFGEGKDLRNYTQEGSSVSIEDGTEEGAVYNLSNLSKIQRHIENCVRPGQGGGDTDSETTCTKVVEKCTLK